MRSTAVAEGTIARAAVAAERFDVARLVFPSNAKLAWHSHPHACTAVVVQGSVQKRFARRCDEAVAGSVISMPAQESHEDVFGRDGATIVVVESQDQECELRIFRDWDSTIVAHRIARELAAPDAFSALAVEGLVLELTAFTAREEARKLPPPWLEEVRARLREEPAPQPTVHELAELAGVGRTELARAFSRAYGENVGAFARHARLEWAADRLRESDESIACIAYRAGFADQSHFTRAFKKRFGVTPARTRVPKRG